jgi:hypothetical protein
VAKQFDIEIGDLSNSLRKMQVAISEAGSGSKSMLETFAALGLKVSDLRRLKPEDQFTALAEAISSLRDPADRARAATDLFGRSGANLLPLFEQGAEGIRKARKEVREFGNVLNDIEVKKLQEADDAIKKLSASWSRFWSSVAVFTVGVGESLDVINKDKLGELNDQLAIANEELRQATDLPEGGAFDPKRYENAAKAVQVLERQIKNLQDTYTRGGGSRRGGAGTAPPGFKPKEEAAAPGKSAFTEEMLRNIRIFQNWRDIVNDAEKGAASQLDDTLKDITQDFGDMQAPIAEVNDEMDVFAEQAARNMQDQFADFLFDPFQDGLKGMLKGFVDVIRRMLAEAAAAQIFSKLFGDTKNGGGNWLGTLLGAFGGGKAQGGPLQSGKWYVAGEHGPEPIWGGGGGAFAMGYGGSGGGGVTINMPVDMRGASVDAVKLLMSEKPRLIRQAADLAKAELRNDKRRGKF